MLGVRPLSILVYDMAKKGSNSQLAKRYAAALFELAKSKGQPDKIAADLEFFAALCRDNKELAQLNISPLISRQTKQAVWAELSAKAGASELTVKFINLLAIRGRLFVLAEASKAFADMLRAERNMVEAFVTSAQPLDVTQTDKITKAIEQASGKSVVLKLDQDPSLLGGMVVRVGSQMVDRSIKGNLDRLKMHLKQAVAA